MLQHILVPLDGSSRAEQALPTAARIARASSGTVVLLRVVSPPTEFVPHAAAHPGTARSNNDAKFAEAMNYLEQTARIGSLSGVRTETVAVAGKAADTILSVIDARAIDLIVMCSHGYTGMKRQVLGSVAESIAHHPPVPLLLLREGGPMPAALQLHGAGFLRALVPLDGSQQARAALIPCAQLIAALSAPAQGTLHLTRVVILPDAQQCSYHEREAILQEAQQYLEAAVEWLRKELADGLVAEPRLDITWSVTIDDDIAAGIIRVAEEGDVGGGAIGTGVAGSSNVIAMVTHGASGLEQWAMASVTERVLQATSLPLLIVRPVR